MSHRPWGVPGHHREVVAEPFKLPPPQRPVPHTAMEQDQRRSGAGAFVGDSEPVNLDLLHDASP